MTKIVHDIDHSARAHSNVGGSTAKRVMNCTASVELCAKYPNVESEFAAEGSALHEATDFILQGKTEKDTEVIGLTFNKYVITQEMYDEAIVPALEYFDMLDKELGGLDYFNEQRVIFPGIDGAFGTVDIVAGSKDRAVVLDWKFGRGVAVDAENNDQLMYYAYAAANTAPTSKLFSKDKPIELFIVQPRVRDGEPFTRWITSYQQLEVFAMELKKAVAISQTSEASFKMGSWCKFCNAKLGCPLYQNAVEDVGMLSQDDLQAQFEKYAPLFDQMTDWAKAGKELMHSEMEKGMQVKGFKLVAKRANRKWVDEDKALKYLARMRVPAADRYTKKFLSPSQAEKVLKTVGVSGLPDGMTEKHSSGTTLTTSSDKRAEVKITATTMELLAAGLAGR